MSGLVDGAVTFRKFDPAPMASNTDELGDAVEYDGRKLTVTPIDGS